MLHCEFFFFFVTTCETVASQYSECNLGIPIWISFMALVIGPGVRAPAQVNLGDSQQNSSENLHRSVAMCPKSQEG